MNYKHRGATCAWAAFKRSLGLILICKPRSPALTHIKSHKMQSSWIKVGKGFFIPKGEQPPRI